MVCLKIEVNASPAGIVIIYGTAEVCEKVIGGIAFCYSGKVTMEMHRRGCHSVIDAIGGTDCKCLQSFRLKQTQPTITDEICWADDKQPHFSLLWVDPEVVPIDSGAIQHDSAADASLSEIGFSDVPAGNIT